MSLYTSTNCPTCNTEEQQIEWKTWCSKCGMVVCSHCVNETHTCQDRFYFGVPRRGKRYLTPRKVG